MSERQAKLKPKAESNPIASPYAGAVGAIFYVEPFSTEDVDVLVNFGPAKSLLVSLEPVLEYLKSHGYTEFEHGAVVIEGWPVQFLPVSDDLTRDALTTTQRIKYDDTLCS